MPKSKAKQALEYARKVAKTSASWIDLHNAMFGIGGKCTELFPDQSARTAFTKTAEYTEITQLVHDLAQQDDRQSDVADHASRASGKLNIRLPRSIHAALVVEAEAEGVSLNQLIVAKLSVQLRAVV